MKNQTETFIIEKLLLTLVHLHMYMYVIHIYMCIFYSFASKLQLYRNFAATFTFFLFHQLLQKGYNSLRDIRHATLMLKQCYVPPDNVTNRQFPACVQVAPFSLVNTMVRPVLG